MFSKSRLANALATSGFFLTIDNSTEVGFVRANCKVGLFESIGCHAGKHRGGKWGEIGHADIGIALTPGRFTAVKGIAESDCLVNWVDTKTKEQSAAFEESVIASAPQRLQELVNATSNELLRRTAETRQAVDRYLALVDRRFSISESITKHSDGASDEELREARRLARTEGLIGLPERHCYDLAAILFVRHSDEIDGSRERFWGRSPNDVPELKWRFHLFSSRLYPEKGWELLNDHSAFAAS